MAIPRATDASPTGFDASGGDVIGLAATSKVGFYGATPVIQQTVVAPATTATTATNEAAIVSINAALVALGLIVTS